MTEDEVTYVNCRALDILTAGLNVLKEKPHLWRAMAELMMLAKIRLETLNANPKTAPAQPHTLN